LSRKIRETFVLVPLIREKSRHITVRARLAGRPVRLIIDTGAGGSIMDSAAAARYQLKLRSRSSKAVGVGAGVLSMSSVARHGLTLAGIDLSRTSLHTIDLSHVNAGLKKAEVRPVVGVIGADVLWRYEAVIDYGKMRLSVR